MDLHRLRVVEFDTSVREKEREKKHIAALENCKKEERKTRTVTNKDGIGYENQCLNENSPPVLSKKCFGEETSPPGTSKKCLGDTSSPPDKNRGIKICANDERTPPRISTQCSNDKLELPETTKKYINDTTFTSHLGTSKNQRSKSEIFKIPPKRNPRKRALKINSSDLGLTKLFQDSAYSHQKKRTLNLRNRSRNARIHHKKENVIKKEKSEEVHFLFAREKPTFIRYRRKRTDNERTKKKRDSKFPNDIYGFQTSSRSLDQNQYQMSHFNFIDTDKLPFKKMRVGFHRKPKPPQPVTKCFCKHHAMRVLNSACGNGDSRPIYYNLGTHPHTRRFQQKHISDQEEGLKRERSHYMTKDEIVEVSPSSFSPVSKSFHDARTGPSKVELTSGSHHHPLGSLEKSTTLQNFTIASEYNQKSYPLPSAPSPYAACAVPTDRQDCKLKKSQTFHDVTSVGNQKPCPLPSSPSPCALCAARVTPAQNKCETKRKKKKRPILVLTLCNGFLSRLVKLVTDFHVRNNMSGKSYIKCVFFGLLIVVWSPCLLAVILAWVVMFPWKLTNILKTDVTAKRSFPINHSFKRFRKNTLRREYQQMCFENYLPEKKRSFMTSAASWYSRTVGVVVNSFNAVISLLKLKKRAPTRAGSSFLPSSHPNPRKRYKLFYAENRGWVMKPLRRRTRSCASNRVWQSMRCEFRPKFWQKLRCQNFQQASLKKVPCPVHGTYNYPMHQSSPAGDACPVQSRNPWPSCTCWDKYLERPPSCMPLNSHHHRQQQVNIHPTFYNTTSDIASISTDVTVYTKPNVFSSIKITNNIAYKNLAKDHLGQRKNETLPFGVVPKGLNKHDVGNTLIKASGVHRITSLTDMTNHLSSCGLKRLGRQTTKRGIPLNCLSARSHNLAIANKNSPTLQKKIYFNNKYVIRDIFQPASTEQANTSTYKVNFAHKTQNTLKHITYQVTNKQKTAKAKAEMDSKCAYEAKLLPPKQEYKYKTDKSRASAQKHPSPAKIKSSIKHDILVNYSFGNKRKQSKQSYKNKPNLVPVTTQMLSNTADITTMTNRDIALNGPCEKEHEKFKYGYKHQAIQKQLCTANITTSTNRNVALNCSLEEDHVLSKYGDKHKPSNPTHQSHQIPVATQMQSRTADNATSTKHNVALNFPFEKRNKLSKHGYKHKPHNVPVAKQMQLKTADITTSTNRNVATNCPCEVKHKLSNQCYKNKPHQILVATQMQSTTAENATDTNRDLALLRLREEKHDLSHHGYKHKPHKITVATQMNNSNQQRTADNATDTNRDVALNHPSVGKPGIANKEKLSLASTTDKKTKSNLEMKLSESAYKCIPGQIPVANQKQSNTAITTMTNCDKALNYPYGEKYEKSEQAYKCKSDHIHVGTQKHPSTSDMITNTKSLGGVTQSTPSKRIPHVRIPSTSDKDTICTQKTNPPEYLSKTQDISIHKHSCMIDASANCVSNYERSKTKDIFHPEQTVLPKKTVDCTDATTSWKKTAPETKTDSFKNLGGSIGASRKLNDPCLYKGTQTIAHSALKREIDRERPMRALSKEKVDCGCGTKLKPIATVAEINFERRADQNLFAHYPSKQPPSPKSSLVGASLEIRNVSTTQPLLARQLQTEELIKQFQPHANSHLFGVASDNRCCLASQRTQVSNLQLNSQQLIIASNCVCGVTRKSSDKSISIDQSKVSKEPRQYGSQNTIDAQGLKPGSITAHPQKTPIATESPPTSTDIQELPCSCKCECNSVPPFKSIFPQYLPRAQPQLSKKVKKLSQFPKSPAHVPSNSSQKSSPLFGMAMDCRCGEARPKNEPDKELKQMKADSKNILTYKTGSGKEPPSKQPNLIQSSSRTSQDQSTFAPDCTCRTNQIATAEKNLYNNVTDSKSTRAKEKKLKSQLALKKSSISEFPKSPEHSPLRKTLPRKCCWKSLPCKCRHKSLPRCRCRVGSLQDSVVKLNYGTKLSKLTSTKSGVRVDKTPKSSDHTPSHEYLQQTRSCHVGGLQDPGRKQSAGTKVNKTFTKRNSVKVDKTQPKFPKSSEHSPPQKYLHHDCTCPVKNLQDPVGKKISQTSRKSVFSRKSKHYCFGFPDECPCSLSQNDINKISLTSDVPVNWNTTKRFFIRSRGSTCSVNELSSRVQSSRISQYSSKVSSLVMSFRSKLFNRKSNQTKIPENPTKKPVIFSSRVEPKKAYKRATSIDDILESLLDDESNQSPFRRSHKSKTPQNPSLPLHKSHSSCSCLIHKSSSRQFSREKQYMCKPSIVDKSYSCLHSVAKTFQRPSSLTHSTKYECRSQSIQSKSSIVKLFTRKSHSKSKSAQNQSSKKFGPKYSSTLINCQQTPTVEQTVRSQLPPSPNTLKLKNSSLFNRPQSKLFFEKIRSTADQISTNTLKDKQNKKVSTPGIQLIYPSNLSKKISHHSVERATIQQPNVSEYIDRSYRCAEEQNFTKEHSSNKKQFEKIPQLHSSHPTATPHNTPLRYFQSTHKKPCICRSFKHGNEQEVSNSLHKIIKNRRLPEKFHKSHLISHVCTCSATARRLKEDIVQRSEISQSPGIQPKQQIQIYEQNLPDLKRLSKIPTIVDKSPPEMLQQHSPGHGRKSTAEGEIQQPYPDLNRVSLRYPGHKSPPKQSLQIPGINGPPLANNYPPAAGATPPPNYACDPYHTNPPKRCLPKSPYDESARRAYKRRPLRYTPPRQQLPRVKKLKENKQRAAEAKRRGIKRTENFFKCLRHLINKTEREVWPADVKCHPMWLNALKRKPCFCIYKAFPRAYPTFLNCYKTHKYIGQLLVYFITLCFWSPLLLCGYLCCNVLCKCCS